MMLLRRTIVFLLLATGCPVFAPAQNNSEVYQLKQKIKSFEQQQNYLNDTAYANALTDLAYIYCLSYPDSALFILSGNAERCRKSGFTEGEVNTYIITGDAFQAKGMYKKALDNFEASFGLAKKTKYESVYSLILNRIGTIHLNHGNYPEALIKFYESLKAAEAKGNDELIGATLNNIAVVQLYQGKLTDAEATYRQRLKVAQKISDTGSMSIAYNGIGEVNLQQKKPSEALQNLTIAYNLASKINDREMILNTMLSLAEAYYALDSVPKSILLFERGMKLANQTGHDAFVCNALIGLANARNKQGMLKEALANGLEALQKAQQMGQVQLMRDANEIVSSVYEAMNDFSNAIKYYKNYKAFSDSMNSLESQRAVTIEKDKYQFSKKEDGFRRQALQQQWIIFSAFAGLLFLSAILWIILRNRNRLKSTYKELQQKNIIIENQKLKAEETLAQLQATQAQLIQSEKMASLGELTAGIAHEIQNPLNFVNNFSEVNNELIDEMNDVNDINDIKAIVTDIKQNSEKIAFHGKRADAIVKGMLQHSRQTKGIKELTDINALCDEYLRLSYHGLRAKDKSFNADFKIDFDKDIGKINVVPQDIGRVLLNLFNNAFYAVNEKFKNLSEVKNIADLDVYKPAVFVKTIKMTNNIEIHVSDNGNGIPQSVIYKIFQPFFTTKPTGQGTGLGLSLAYDTITKQHNGTIKAESTEGKGTTFIIRLPAS